MSVSVARRKRTALYFSITGLMLIVAALSAISARDPDGVTIRTGMTLVALGAAIWLPWQALLPAVVAIWLGANISRNAVESYELFNLNMMIELPSLLGLAAVATAVHNSLRELEQENIMLGMTSDSVGTDPVTGVFEESQLRGSLEIELSRSRRFNRTFALVLVGIDEMRQRFDYRDEEVWQSSFAATADLLRGTRANVDRVYRYGPAGFALVLPESDPKDVNGLVRRLRRVARKVKPQEGEPGGPLPAHYGATFYPTCATTVDDLIRRAEIALRISDNNASRVQLDGAEAPEMPPVETLRQPQPESVVAQPEAAGVSEANPAAPPSLRIEAAGAITEVEAEPLRAVEKPAIPKDAGMAAPLANEPETPRPSLTVVDQLAHDTELKQSSAEAEPLIAREEPEEPQTLVGAETPRPVLATTDEPDDESAGTESSPAPIYAVQEQLDAIQTNGEAQLELFAFRAPEPAVDVYNNNWQAEAPLSVIRRPRPTPTLAAIKGGASTKQEPDPPVDEVVSDALKQLDGTLELIRSLKKRSA